MIARAFLFSVMAATSAAAQVRDYARTYAFAERAPRTRLEKVIDALLPSIVKVHGASGLRTIKAYATGVIVSPQGHVLTLDLVMIQHGQTRVVLNDGTVLDAEVLPSDRGLGVRMLKIDPKGHDLVPLRPARKRRIENGTFVASLGNCFRLAEFSEKVSATFGVVTATTHTGLRYRMSDLDYDGELIVTDAPNNPGQYGGPLVTLSGEWIGLDTRLVESTETNTQISAAIPSWDLAAYIDRCVRGQPAASRPVARVARQPVYHGIVLFDQGRRRSPPAYVDRTERGSPGRRAGLRPDDLIVRIDEYPVRSCKEFRAVMARFAPGTEVQLTYKRGRKVKRVGMELEAKR